MIKDIIYPFFLYCTKYTTDEFWKNIFEDLSFGETPTGVFISKNMIQSIVKGKEFVYKINPTEDPEKIYTDLRHILSDKMNILSPTELQKNKSLVPRTKTKVDKWSNIKKKTIKDILLSNYVVEICKEKEVSKNKTNDLLDIITLFISLKILDNNDIILSDNKIVKIDGLFFDENMGTFRFDKHVDFTNNDIEVIEENKKMISEWKKFIGQLEKSEF